MDKEVANKSQMFLYARGVWDLFAASEEEQSQNLTPEQLPAVVDEIADVQVCLLRIATKLDVNILEAVEQKMLKNAAKYPADKVRGSAKKYDQYD